MATPEQTSCAGRFCAFADAKQLKLMGIFVTAIPRYWLFFKLNLPTAIEIGTPLQRGSAKQVLTAMGEWGA